VDIIVVGFLFQKRPSVLISTQGAQLAFSVFKRSTKLQLKLLTALLDYLRAESISSSSLDKSVDESNFLDVSNGTLKESSGLSSCISQTHLDDIIQALLFQGPLLRQVALDVVGCIAEQGLVHPLQYLPALAAVQTCQEDIRHKAFFLHSELAEKHPSFIHTRNTESIELAYRFQQSLAGGKEIKGWMTVGYDQHVEACLQGMFALGRERKQGAHEFIHSLVKLIPVDVRPETRDTADTQLVKFILENLGHLVYKTMDEVVLVVCHVNRIVSAAGGALSCILEHDEDKASWWRWAAILGGLAVLKAHLKHTYQIPNNKCHDISLGDLNVKDKTLTQLVLTTPMDWTSFPYLLTKELLPDMQRAAVQCFADTMMHDMGELLTSLSLDPVPKPKKVRRKRKDSDASG
jgi:hypothetical protein